MANERQIELINQDIKKAKEVLDAQDINKIYKCFDKLAKKYQEYNIKVYTNEAFCYDTEEYNYEYFPEFLELLIEKLELYRAKLEDTDKEKKQNGININNTNTSTSNATISQNITLYTTIDKIDEISDKILNQNLKNELKGMLGDIERQKDIEQKKSKLIELIKWLGDKAADATIACLPYLAGLAH